MKGGMQRLEVGRVSRAESYFYVDVLRKSADITVGYSIQWTTLGSLAMIWVAVYFCIYKGVESAGIVVYLTVPLPVLILFILVLRGITLDDAIVGLRAFITPDFSVLWDVTIWQTAVSQIFFSISAAMGIMTSYASHNPKTQNVVQVRLCSRFAHFFAHCFAHVLLTGRQLVLLDDRRRCGLLRARLHGRL
jgi:SNF family Na+-dependent transporter